MSSPRTIAENNFSQASAHAALFELRVRLRAGAVPTSADLPIDTNLANVVMKVIEHYQDRLSDTEKTALKEACRLRNKVLHCEFSTARKLLDPDGTQSHSGGVVQVSGVTPENVLSTLNQLNAGKDVGQQAVSGTATKKHRDLFGWLLESHSAGEFADATEFFKKAIALIDRLSDASQDN